MNLYLAPILKTIFGLLQAECENHQTILSKSILMLNIPPQGLIARTCHANNFDRQKKKSKILTATFSKITGNFKILEKALPHIPSDMLHAHYTHRNKLVIINEANNLKYNSLIIHFHI